MTEELKIEEMLNSFVDGELSLRQRTEVKRMAANDPKIASRLRLLQKCRTLVSVLPVAKAPSCVMENIKASLAAKTLENEKSTVSISEYRHEKKGFFLFRRVFAAAAVLTMAAVLVAVINILITPQTSDNHLTASDIKFSGKLELKSSDLNGVQSVISRAIENSGLVGSSSSIKEGNRYLYTINCSREGLNKFLGDLDSNWDKLYSAELFVETKTFSENVEIKAVTPSQIAAVVNQANTDQSIQTARNIAVINSVNELLQDRNVTSPDQDLQHGLFTIPQPIETKNDVPTQKDDGEKTVQLRIILSR